MLLRTKSVYIAGRNSTKVGESVKCKGVRYVLGKSTKSVRNRSLALVPPPPPGPANGQMGAWRFCGNPPNPCKKCLHSRAGFIKNRGNRKMQGGTLCLTEKSQVEPKSSSRPRPYPSSETSQWTNGRLAVSWESPKPMPNVFT